MVQVEMWQNEMKEQNNALKYQKCDFKKCH